MVARALPAPKPPPPRAWGLGGAICATKLSVRQAGASTGGRELEGSKRETETVHIPPCWWNVMTCWPFSRAFVVSFVFR